MTNTDAPALIAPATDKAAKKAASKSSEYEYTRLARRAIQAADAQRMTAQEALKKAKDAVIEGRDAQCRRLLLVAQEAAAGLLTGVQALIEGLREDDGKDKA